MKYPIAVIAASAALVSFFCGEASELHSSAGCSATLTHPECKVERTLALIKPDAVAANHIGEIIARLEQSGLRVIALKMVKWSEFDAQQFYNMHRDRPFFAHLVKYMSCGPIVAIVLEGKDAVAHYRAIMGATDPAAAGRGTLRALYGSSIEANGVHGSDSIENAQKEISLLFTESL